MLGCNSGARRERDLAYFGTLTIRLPIFCWWLTVNLNSVDQVMTDRHSVRAFSEKKPDVSLIRAILDAAAQSPSGSNTQPWRVYVLQGQSLAELIRKVCLAHEQVRAQPELAAGFRQLFHYYPKEWPSPYLERRRDNGRGFYGVLGIARGDKEGMHQQDQRNYRFFDAPVGLIFTINKSLGQGSWIDYGIFLQSIMLSAKGHGLDTCVQASWNGFANVVLPHIGAAECETVVCGMALGYAEEEAPINHFRTPRAPVDSWTTWLDDLA